MVLSTYLVPMRRNAFKNPSLEHVHNPIVMEVTLGVLKGPSCMSTKHGNPLFIRENNFNVNLIKIRYFDPLP